MTYADLKLRFSALKGKYKKNKDYNPYWNMAVALKGYYYSLILILSMQFLKILIIFKHSK